MEIVGVAAGAVAAGAGAAGAGGADGALIELDLIRACLLDLFVIGL
jgi:hypothetical protein